jgi:RNA polymerase sigma-70 factor (ECF subfamily)
MTSGSTEVDAVPNGQRIALPPVCLLQWDGMRRHDAHGQKVFSRAMAQAETRATSLEDGRRSAWMAAAQAGDHAAYEALLRDCVGVIESVARRRGVSADRIDDVVQDTLLTVHRARQTYDPARPFTAWLRVIAERRAIDLMRKTGRHRVREVHAPLAYEQHADEGAAGPRTAYGAEPKGRLGDAVADLPPRQREAVQHLVLQERSLAEAAAATGRTKLSLKVNLHRALKSLRARLGQVG